MKERGKEIYTKTKMAERGKRKGREEWHDQCGVAEMSCLCIPCTSSAVVELEDVTRAKKK